jgi:phytoene dehydrogenase-like protein
VPDTDELTVDVAIIGAGHNALIAAGYLAKAGLEVAVLEGKPIVGGNTVTEELTLPGWQHDSCSSAHAVIQSNPVLRDDELGLLSHYGLRYKYTEPASVLPLDDDAIVLHRSLEATADELARFSSHDARRLVEMIGDWQKTLKFAHRRWNEGQPYADLPGGAAYEALLRQSASDVIHTNFEHDMTHRLLSWMGFATFQPPTRPGTGILPISILSGRLEYGWATPVGGSGALPNALVNLIVDHGGQAIRNAPVTKIVITNGRAAGVETAQGRRVTARMAVVSSAHITTLPDLVGANTTEDLHHARASWQPGIALFAVHAALRQDVRYRVRDDLITSTAAGLGSPEGTRRQVAGCLSGHPEMDDPWMLLVSSTAVDPDRAPGGTFKILTAAPQTLASGATWEEFGPQYAQRLLSIAGRYAEGLGTADVLAVLPETPSSLAGRNLQNIGGSCHGGEFLMDSGEYLPGWPRHDTDIPGLFLTGSTAHPGGSVSGWPGRNAAQSVLSSLGMDPTRVMAVDGSAIAR